MFALAAAALMTAAQPASPPADRDQDQFRAIMRAVHSDGRLWLLTDDGKMVTIADQGDAPSPVSLPEPARDLCLWRGSPLIVTRNRDSTELTARRYDGGRWKWLASVPIEEEGLVALNCSDQRVTLITSDRLVELQGGSTREIPLSDRLGRGRVTSTGLAVDGHLYVGLNAGEWGGGLKRIDRSSGKVETVERNSTGGLCDGPLNTSCDPVHAIAVEPWKPDCVAAAVGLVHFMSHGRLVEVCGKTVKRIYFKPYDDGLDNKPKEKTDEPFSTVAFFGLSRSPNGLVAVGIDGLYRLRGPGEPEFVELPKFRNVGGYWLSYDLPDAILVLTNINQRASVSGAVPMLVPR